LRVRAWHSPSEGGDKSGQLISATLLIQGRQRYPPSDSDIRKFAGEADVAVTLYGIKNCDTMKKARAWLDAKGVAYRFHDYKGQGIERSRLDGWAAKVGWEMLLNRAGTTFRKLPDRQKQGLTRDKAIALMLEQPSMIKRPVLEAGGKLLVGFRPADYQSIL
jgi:arsenate reductase (glutaredoxin)